MTSTQFNSAHMVQMAVPYLPQMQLIPNNSLILFGKNTIQRSVVQLGRRLVCCDGSIEDQHEQEIQYQHDKWQEN